MRRRLLVGALATAAGWPAAASVGKPQLLEFWASWCGVCRAMEPTMAALKERWGKQVDIRIVDVDEPENAALVRRYKIFGTATFVLLDGRGKETYRGSGQIPQAVFESEFKKVL
ncbi:thioredoxin domain-containing protein [Gloeobacter morelensis]|uniref:Thioredoxin fold domain-containing protein n=1 Tax=Gloeobacter morelensis MG652769 TaxID=2781736 RepID=A0ABY3PKM9_9CYAN|nr:thioredoxin domain-containing protein [Gloeobacter morelensis]UFP94220.1 thioredoxin fold domain-containing protein [Gloeobacter morelensis MG652769]